MPTTSGEVCGGGGVDGHGTNQSAQLFLTATVDSSLDENGISNRKIQKETTLFGLKLCFSGGKADFCGGLWSFDAHCGTFATAVVSEA